MNDQLVEVGVLLLKLLRRLLFELLQHELLDALSNSLILHVLLIHELGDGLLETRAALLVPNLAQHAHDNILKLVFERLSFLVVLVWLLLAQVARNQHHIVQGYFLLLDERVLPELAELLLQDGVLGHDLLEYLELQ